MARNTKAKAVTVTFVEAFAASVSILSAKATIMDWARSVCGNRKPKESEADFRKRAFFAAGAEIFEAGEEYFWLLDQKLLEQDTPEYKLASKPGGKPHSLCSAIYDVVKEKYPKTSTNVEQVEDKGWSVKDDDVVTALTKLCKAKKFTSKAALIGYLDGLSAS